jgi:hypothetical protein
MSIIDSVPVLDAAISMSAGVALSLTWKDCIDIDMEEVGLYHGTFRRPIDRYDPRHVRQGWPGWPPAERYILRTEAAQQRWCFRTA